MIANVHDIVLTIGFMSITQLEFDLTSIAALLTILGYSLNDTVVIYDRIREMLRRYKKMPMPQLLNSPSTRRCRARSSLTSRSRWRCWRCCCSAATRSTASPPMMFGVVLVGTYTSIFIAAPILIYLGVGDHRADVEEKPARSEAANSDKAAKQPETAKPEKTAKSEKTAKPEKTVKPEKPATPQKPAKP